VELVLLQTKSFEKDLRKLHPNDRKRVVRSLDRERQRYEEDPDSIFHSAFQPLRIKLIGGFDSSLYVYRVGRRLRMLFTLDKDPIYNQLIVILQRVISRADMEKVLRSTADSLYQAQLAEISYVEEEDNGSD
jgi:mRNA-degrading endonuclease RelE of RelBE toxin-antitoxin system